jgi:hypothetical protein
MHSRPILFIIFLLIKIPLSHNVIRGEKTCYSLYCPIPNALWFGPNNQSIIANSYKYEIKYSSDNVQLIIDHLTSFDEGEYICINNETNYIVKQYKLKVGTIKNVLHLFFIIIISILILIPIFWYLGKKYSGIHQ